MGKKTKDQTQHKLADEIILQNFGFVEYDYIGVVLVKDSVSNLYSSLLIFHMKCDKKGRTKEALHHELQIEPGNKADVLKKALMGAGILYGSDRVLDKVLEYSNTGDLIGDFNISDLSISKKSTKIYRSS